MPVLSLLNRFLPYVLAIKRQALVNVVLLLIAPLISAALLWSFKLLIDEVFIAGRGELFVVVAGLYAAAAAIKIAVEYIAQHVEANAIESIVLAIRSDLYAHLLSLSPGTLDKTTSGDLLARLEGDTVRAETLVYTAPLLALADTAATVIFVGLLFLLNWQLTLCTLAALPIIIWIVHHYAPLVRKASELSRKGESHWMSLAEERLSAIPLVQAFSAGKREEGAFRHRAGKVRRMEARSQILQAQQSAWVEAVVAFAGLGILMLGAGLIERGTLTIGGLVTFIGTVGSLYSPVRSLAKTAGRFQHAAAGAERVVRLLDTQSLVRERKVARRLDDIRGRIEFENVHFAYPETGRSVLCGLSFKVEPGKTLAVVGPSGSGKTSLIRLLLRQYDCDRGVIRIDGHDIRDLTLSTIHKAISPVFQDAMVFSGTIERNIRYGAPGVPADRVAGAARAAAVLNFASAKGGLVVPVGSHGSRLSGGQRQRVALARALLTRSPVLLLDEATAGIDSETEELIQDALEALSGHRTIVVVAHRLSTVRRADQVVVVENGRIVEEGPPSSLFGGQSRCRQLFAAQLIHKEAAE
jgi:ABC-type multidrug transport system fused ATPase/permease subunit